MTCDLRRGTKRDWIIAKAYRCIADGKDITDQTFYVDARRRRVGVLALNDQGRPFMNDAHELVRLFIHPRRVRLVKKKEMKKL